MAFKKASKEQAKLRMALMGPAGSGKTMTALRIAGALGDRVAVLDTEAGSASKYADRFHFDADSELPDFHPHRFVKAIQEAEKAGYNVLIIDSLSHAWAGKGGALELVDQETKRSKSQNSYMAWGAVTPIWNSLLEAIVRSRLHIIATLRTKMEHVLEEVGGKKVPRKVGMAPIARDSSEYEFDLVMDLDNGTGVITKSRAPDLNGKVIQHPGEELGLQLRAWLSDGVAPVQEPPTEPPPDPGEWLMAIDSHDTPEDLMRLEPEVRAIANAALRKTVGAAFNARLRTLRAQTQTQEAH